MRILFFALLAGLSLHSLTAQDEILLSSEISSVTVFQRSAQLTRKATVKIPAGKSRLIFSRLSQDMDPASILLRGQGNLSILSIGHRHNYLSEENLPAELQSLQEQIETLEMDIRKLKAREDGLRNEKEMIIANRNIGGTASGISFEQLQRIAQYTSERISEINIRIEEIRQEIKEKEEEKRKLQNQSSQQRSSFGNMPGEVVVEIEAAAPTTANLELSYLIRSAGWSSSYDARVNEIGQPLELTHKAKIWQQTGEDWKNVEMILSTGNPTIGGQVPYLSTWYVGYQQRYINGVEVRAQKALRNADVAMEDDEAAPGGASQQQFSIVQNITQQEFHVDRKQSIFSGSNPTTVQLREIELPASYEYHLKPRLDNDAFLIAKVYDWERFDLLAGEIALFNRTTYVGKSYLNVANPLDTIQLSLGRDKGLVVKRERVYDKQENSFLGGKKIDNFRWRIEIRNNKREAVKILLKDQVPVSRHEDIEVEIESKGEGILDTETGILKWEFKLNPSQSRSIEYGYQLKYPKDKAIYF